MKKRVLFFDHTAKMSGGERSLLLILDKIDKTRFYPLLVTPEEGPLTREAVSRGIDVTIIGLPTAVIERKRSKTGIIFLLFSFIALVPAVVKLVLLIRKCSIDLVYTNSQKAHLIGLCAGLCAGVPVIWHFRDIVTEAHLRKLMSYSGALFATGIIAISRAVAAQFTICSRVSGKVMVIHNAIDISDFQKRKRESHADLRKEFHLPEKSVIIASVGQIAEWKGQEYCIYAARELVRRFDNVYFFIIGKPLFKEENYNIHIHTLVKELNLEQRVFFTGFRRDIPALMHEVNFLLHTPVEPEPFGRVLIEAMAAGTPVVAFDNGATAEVLRGNMGLLVRPLDTRGIIKAISILLKDDDLYANTAKRAQEYVRKYFDFPLLMERIEKLLAKQ